MTLLAKVTLNDLATLVLWLVILRKIFHSVCSYEATWVKRGWVVLNWFWAMSRLIEQDRWTKFQNQNFFKILLWYLLFLTYHTNPPVGNLCTKSKSFNGHKEKSFLRLGVNPNVHTTPIRASHRRVSSLFFLRLEEEIGEEKRYSERAEWNVSAGRSRWSRRVGR